MSRAPFPSGLAPTLPHLAKVFTARIRRACLARAAAVAAIGGAWLVVAVEIAARVVPIAPLRTLEAAVLATSTIAATVIYLRKRPSPSAWRAVADGMTPEAGVFSAVDEDARATRLTPLVERRAELSAIMVLATPRSPVALTRSFRLAVLASLLAVVTVILPGRKPSSDEIDPELQARVSSEVASLRDEAARASDPATGDILRSAAASLDQGRLSPSEAVRLSERLSEAALEKSSRNRELADALARRPLLREIAEALRREDPAALDRALERLLARSRDLEARSPVALEAAALLLELAASERDPRLKKALADAGEALSAGSGPGASDRLGDLAEELRRLLRSSQAIRDVVVTLQSAGNAGDPGDSERPGSAPVARAASGLPRESGGGTLPMPPDFRSLVRPGTSDEVVLRRYFAVQE